VNVEDWSVSKAMVQQRLCQISICTALFCGGL
jgi:hypothetical protein